MTSFFVILNTNYDDPEKWTKSQLIWCANLKKNEHGVFKKILIENIYTRVFSRSVLLLRMPWCYAIIIYKSGGLVYGSFHTKD